MVLLVVILSNQRVASKTGLTAAKAMTAIINDAREKLTKVQLVQALVFMLKHIWIISLNRSKKVVIKIGDVLILVKIIQVNCIGNLCLDFNFGKSLMKIFPYSINKGLMGPKLEFSA